MKRRDANSSSLSFLDVMCCGFGAVVLLVMLLNGQTLQKREETHADLTAAVERADRQNEFAREHLAELRKQAEEAEKRQAELIAEAEKLKGEIEQQKNKNQKTDSLKSKAAQEIESLKKQVASAQSRKKELTAVQAQKRPDRKRVGFDGDGRRQYLTGLKLGGERTLILLDSSASMLDETIVNIIRLKLMDEATRRRADKWQRVVRSTHWLVANLRPKKSFQIIHFNTAAQPVIPGTAGKWLSTSDQRNLDAAMDGVRKLAPLGGTSLAAAFAAIRQMDPKPDSVLLLTDGLPTQGKAGAQGNTISGEERARLFTAAVRGLVPNVPINTLLFPIEGDPLAAFSFWSLAVKTKGSFITPSRDWP